MRSWTHVTVPQEGPRQTPQASTTRPVSGRGGLLVRAPDWSRPAPDSLLGVPPPPTRRPARGPLVVLGLLIGLLAGLVGLLCLGRPASSPLEQAVWIWQTKLLLLTVLGLIVLQPWVLLRCVRAFHRERHSGPLPPEMDALVLDHLVVLLLGTGTLVFLAWLHGSRLVSPTLSAPAFLLGLVPPLLAEWCLLRALRGRGAV
jgi:hypothetical protein